jgi:hypothetical protein
MLTTATPTQEDTMSRVPRHEKNRRGNVDLTAMREEATRLLGFEVDADEAAEIACTNGRTWRKWESEEKVVPDSVVKLFWFDVTLSKLEAMEADGKTSEIEALLGGSMTIKRVMDLIHDNWQRHDPLVKRTEG